MTLMITDIYKREMQSILQQQQHLTIVEASVEDLLLLHEGPESQSQGVRGITTGAGES